ncbi:GGDEF domain-containing protein, partial [Pseudomonas citronellolis]|uniref:GGDEF domain-containing protein n=1 Tax=Pseudomonas citronellolis TaxID=53408 RepID=UPI0023E370FD
MSYLLALRRSLDLLHGVPPSIRDEFAAWYRRAKVPQIRYVAFLTLVLYVIYAAIEQNVAASQQGLRLVAHGLVVPAALLGVALMSYSSAWQLPMLALLRTAPVGAVAANLYFNAGHDDFAYFVPEIYLNLTWTFAVSGLTVRQAMPTACASLALLLAVTLGEALQPGAQRLHFIWVLASFSFGLLCAVTLEMAHKSMYLQQSRLALTASVDSLTGLWNRSRIDQFLADEIARSARYGSPFAVVAVDIDHFKSVNDTYGHAVGDRVLVQFAGLLREHVRVMDRVGRRGGEEFLVVLPGTDVEHARAAALLLQRRINAFAFDCAGRKTASFGVAEYRPGESLAALLERADQALYAAKA